MIKPRIIKPMMLLAFIGIVLIALVEPITANNMGQGNMGQTNSINSGTDKQANMMPCMMEKSSDNGKMVPCTTGEQSSNGTMTPCMMNQSTDTEQTGPEYTRFWLQKAIMMHEMHLRDPSTMTKESNMIMMDQMKQAYKCDTGKNITENMTARMMGQNMSMGTMGQNMGMGMMGQNTSTTQNRQDCTSFWLLKAIALHDLHMKDPKESANESSQMLLMTQMIQAFDCIPVSKVSTGVTKSDSIAQARLTCADFWLQKAIEFHKIHLKDPSTATEESQMEMMNQMMLAHECIVREKMTTGKGEIRLQE